MDALAIFFFFVLGAMLASFAAVISERLDTGQSWTRGRSACNSCDRTLNAFDLIPILSWVASGGACRTCRARVPAMYAVGEVALGGLFASSYAITGITPALPFLLSALFLLAVIVLYDLRHTIVPMAPAVLLIASASVYAFLAAPDRAALGTVFMLAGTIAFGFFLMHVLSNGRWMGLGDAPVALGLSLLAGTNAVSGLLFSFWIGAVIGIAILVARPKGHRMGIEVPFVPFLAAGYLLAFFTQWSPFLF